MMLRTRPRVKVGFEGSLKGFCVCCDLLGHSRSQAEVQVTAKRYNKAKLCADIGVKPGDLPPLLPCPSTLCLIATVLQSREVGREGGREGRSIAKK